MLPQPITPSDRAPDAPSDGEVTKYGFDKVFGMGATDDEVRCARSSGQAATSSGFAAQTT